jgi:hypothetical protein
METTTYVIQVSDERFLCRNDKRKLGVDFVYHNDINRAYVAHFDSLDEANRIVKNFDLYVDVKFEPSEVRILKVQTKVEPVRTL